MTEVKKAFVYLWRDSLNKKWYLGKHVGSEDDNYTHSSCSMESFSSNNVPSYMKRRIIFSGSPSEVSKVEVRLLRRLKNRPWKWNSYYNNAVNVWPAKSGIRTTAFKPTEKYIITKKQFKALKTIAESRRRGYMNRLCICFLYYSGITPDELCKLKIKDVLDSDGNILDSIILSDKNYPLYICNKLKKEIRRFLLARNQAKIPRTIAPAVWLSLDNYLMASQKSGSFSSQTIQNIVRDIGRVFGVSSGSFRATFINQLINKNLPVKVVQKLARMKSVQALVGTYYPNQSSSINLTEALNNVYK